MMERARVMSKGGVRVKEDVDAATKAIDGLLLGSLCAEIGTPRSESSVSAVGMVIDGGDGDVNCSAGLYHRAFFSSNLARISVNISSIVMAVTRTPHSMVV
jgi:hypothetical protein